MLRQNIMSHGVQTNAMAEIALALAMGFFSIMILAMVSMGAGIEVPKSVSEIVKLDPSMTIASATRTSNAKEDRDAASAVKIENLLIFYDGRYLNAKLEVVDLGHFIADKDRIILAIPHYLNFLDVTVARQQVPARDVVVTPLNEQWSKILKEKFDDR